MESENNNNNNNNEKNLVAEIDDVLQRGVGAKVVVVAVAAAARRVVVDALEELAGQCVRSRHPFARTVQTENKRKSSIIRRWIQPPDISLVGKTG